MANQRREPSSHIEANQLQLVLPFEGKEEAMRKKSPNIPEDVISRIRLAGRHPLALFVGLLLGAFVPVASYVVGHQEVPLETGWMRPALLLVLGGLAYSAKTVWQWCRLAFGCPWKATGFTVLVEGVMSLSHTPWLALCALALLVAINATDTGCRLALAPAPSTRRSKSGNSRVPLRLAS